MLIFSLRLNSNLHIRYQVKQRYQVLILRKYTSVQNNGISSTCIFFRYITCKREFNLQVFHYLGMVKYQLLSELKSGAVLPDKIYFRCKWSLRNWPPLALSFCKRRATRIKSVHLFPSKANSRPASLIIIFSTNRIESWSVVTPSNETFGKLALPLTPAAWRYGALK